MVHGCQFGLLGNRRGCQQDNTGKHMFFVNKITQRKQLKSGQKEAQDEALMYSPSSCANSVTNMVSKWICKSWSGRFTKLDMWSKIFQWIPFGQERVNYSWNMGLNNKGIYVFVWRIGPFFLINSFEDSSAAVLIILKDFFSLFTNG